MSQYSSAGGYMSPSGSQGNNSPATRASQSIRPVSIAQVRKSTQMHSDAEWKLENATLGQITVVAEVHEHTPYTTNRNFVLDDGTGIMTAKMWVDTPDRELQDEWRGLPVGKDRHDWVRVTGHIKSHAGKKYIHISNIRLVKDMNEVFFHILDTIYVHVVLQKGLPSSTSGGQGQPTAGAYAVQSRPATAAKLFSPLADSVAHFLTSQPTNPEGVSVADIARALKCDAMELSSTVERMIDDGHVFTTIDESHIQLAT